MDDNQVIDLTAEEAAVPQDDDRALPGQAGPADPLYDSIVARLVADLGSGLDAAWLCGPVRHWPSEAWDAGWGCGWRNCQMLLSHLQATARDTQVCKWDVLLL